MGVIWVTGCHWKVVDALLQAQSSPRIQHQIPVYPSLTTFASAERSPALEPQLNHADNSTPTNGDFTHAVFVAHPASALTAIRNRAVTLRRESSSTKLVVRHGLITKTEFPDLHLRHVHCHF